MSSNLLTAANISEGMMGTLSREDLRDLFPGPENFFRRKAVWHTCHGVLDEVSLALTTYPCNLAAHTKLLQCAFLVSFPITIRDVRNS